MTTNPEVLRLAREIAELTIPDDTDGPDREYERLIARDAAITAIERTTELAIARADFCIERGHGDGSPPYFGGMREIQHELRDLNHLRQSEKDNSA